MKKCLVLAALLSVSVVAVAADSGRLYRDADLKADHFSDARTLAHFPARTPLEVLSRRGGWYHVEVQGKRGWVRMTRVRLGAAAPRSAAADSKGLGSALRFLTTGRSGTSNVTVATGIRGLQSADVAHATPDTAAVKKLQKLAVSERDARHFARRKRLKSETIAYLPAPKPTASGAGTAPNSGNPFLGGGE